MRALEQLFHKKRKIIVGLMSGTSADGIDAVVVEVRGSGPQTKIRQLGFITAPYPAGYKQFLLKNSRARTARVDEITRLDALIAQFFADAVRRVVRKAGLRMDEIDLIGSHGQTIHHLPQSTRMYGKNIRSTLQIGNPSIIAKLTGVVTVGDFRVGDVAVGGSGAPLVPIFDYLLLRSRTRNRIALNIGGIANMTILPKNCSLHDVRAFDTGPGNMIIDALMQQFFKQSFDRNGIKASRGRIFPDLLRWMLAHPYFKMRPPKSTGRELFGEEFVSQLLRRTGDVQRQDIVATVSELTPLSIYDSYLRFVKRSMIVDELLVSGGGVHNPFIMDALKIYFAGADVLTTNELHISSDAKEAICFALLANETISGHPANVPGATGASKQTVLGVIALP